MIDARGTRTVQWIDMYEKLNLFIADDQYLGLGEDKQLGPFFIEFDMSDSDIRKRQIKNKLLHYLWNDIQKASYKVEIKLFDTNAISLQTGKVFINRKEESLLKATRRENELLKLKIISLEKNIETLTTELKKKSSSEFDLVNNL